MIILFVRTDNILVMASEVGVYDVDPKDVLLKVGKEKAIC
jgi:hypothetical protein